jgi:hypothetical protein
MPTVLVWLRSSKNEIDNTAQLDIAFAAGRARKPEHSEHGVTIPVRGAAARGAMAAHRAGTLLVSAFMTGMRLERMFQP